MRVNVHSFALHRTSGADGEAMASRVVADRRERASELRPQDVDAEIVAAIRAGDANAEEIFYRRHAPSIFRVAFRLLRSREDACDVTQDTFLTAFDELGDLRDAHAVRGWLHQMAVRLVHRRFRRRKMRRWLGLSPREDARLEEQVDNSARIEARAELRLLDDALDRVPPAEKIAWVLRQVEGLSLDEVAQACRCSLATAKRRISAVEALVSRHVQRGGGS